MIITYNSPISDLLPFLDRMGITVRLHNLIQANKDCEVYALLNADVHALIDMHFSKNTIAELNSIKPEIETYIKSLSFKDALNEELADIKEMVEIYQTLIHSLTDRIKILERTINKI